MNLPNINPKESMSEEKLLWSEEFNQGTGSAPDPKIWGRDLGDGTSHGIPGWGNNELQVYTDQNAFVNADGHLELEAKKTKERDDLLKQKAGTPTDSSGTASQIRHIHSLGAHGEQCRRRRRGTCSSGAHDTDP